MNSPSPHGPVVPRKYWLEHRVPPPIVALLVAVGMWALARVMGPALDVPHGARILALAAPALLGVRLAIAARRAFSRAGTTVNPLSPHEASALVTTGVFARTRNPMYVGMMLVLLGWAAYLMQPWVWAGPLMFALWIDRLQIVPEERALRARFGSVFTDYAARVRRWV